MNMYKDVIKTFYYIVLSFIHNRTFLIILIHTIKVKLLLQNIFNKNTFNLLTIRCYSKLMKFESFNKLLRSATAQKDNEE